MDSEIRKLHSRLDQIEHLLNQHNGRQRKLDAAASELATIRNQVTQALEKFESPKALLKKVDEAVAAAKKVAEIDAVVEGLTTQVAFLSEKVG